MDETTPNPPAQVSVDQFLQQVRQKRQPAGRLLFAIDATASRQPTWDRACQLQSELFAAAEGLGGLEVQLCFYRGFREFRASAWHRDPKRLIHAGSMVRCRGGQTQIGRVLRHALGEHREKPLHAVVFVGDCMEESLDELCQLAGEMGLLRLPLFLFQEGNDPVASEAFREMARLSGGAHCRFDHASADRLAELLRGAALYAVGGRKALKAYAHSSPALEDLSRQLERGRR